MTDNKIKLYCHSLTNYHRRQSHVVNIGDIPLGGDNPIRLQSMTNTLTQDTKATVEQSIRLIEAGSEYVRITAPGIKDAENLAVIKSELRKQGYKTPLIADIHFNPKAAQIAAKHVEKVRINPGNFVDKKKFQTMEYTDVQYQEEINKIRSNLVPLLNICKEHDTALRIGTNHGSLSDRIMSRYGDTPLGMVESALEFLRICGEEDFQQVVLSMKASNTRVMIQAYRLLVQKMNEEGMHYPLHLGVTEAGEGEDGRIKSAIGIGALLSDGLGDTVRVSLTEEPESEIPVARKLVSFFQPDKSDTNYAEITSPAYNPYEFDPRESASEILGENINLPAVVISADASFGKNTDKIKADYTYSNNPDFIQQTKDDTFFVTAFEIWQNLNNNRCFPLITSDKIIQIPSIDANKIFVKLNLDLCTDQLIENLSKQKNCVLVFESQRDFVPEARLFFDKLHSAKITNPVILSLKLDAEDAESMQLRAASKLGAILSDGFGDGIWIDASENIPKSMVLSASFGILQACRLRVTKTEYISCPSCGRTLFDLQSTTARVREKTSHLKGLKIAVMGCIVNGPGEMADADYGYVGSGPGKISLYKGHEVVKKNIASDDAVEELVQLIKDHGDWKEEGSA